MRPNSTSHTPGYYSTRPAPSPRLPEIPEARWEVPAPPRSPLSRANYSGQRAAQGARYAEQSRPGPRYTEQSPPGDYYEEEERSTALPADVQEDWGDDTAGMRYGDWEDEPGYTNASHYQETDDYAQHTSHPRPVTRPPAQEISPVPPRLAQQHSRHDPLATRELYRVTSDNLRPAVLRETRETRLPVPAPHTQITPAPQAARSMPRNTQPLNPQQMVRVPGEMLTQHTQRPMLPNTPRETNADYTIMVNSAPHPKPNVCQICQGAGYLRSNVALGHPQFGKLLACQCKELERKRKRRDQLRELSNLGAFANKRFDNFTRQPGLQEAFQKSGEFANDPNGWLLFVGPNGCGKTHLAAAIANSCLEAGAVVLFATVPDLLDHLRAAFAPESEEVYDQLFARMREAEVLVLDDLGTQQSSPWANEKLFQLLNYRYNSGFPTVITANLKGFQATDERIRSRLGDTGLVFTLNLDRAQDYRPRNIRRD